MSNRTGAATFPPSVLNDELCIGGYWCVVCGRHLPEENGVIAHDNVPHPESMTFDEEEKPQ